MARMQVTQKFPLGTRVSKYFNGYPQAFGGAVDHYAPETRFYHVSYDDGDSEEMTEDDVDVHFHYLPGAGSQVPPVPTKKEQTARKRRVHSKPKRMRSPPPPEVSSSDKADNAGEAEEAFSMVLSLNAQAPPLRVDIPSETAQDVEMDTLEEEEDEEEEEEVIDFESIEDADDDETVGAEEINQLINKPVVKHVPKSDGSGAVEAVNGTVSIFFPATKMFRVMYYNGDCEDLSYKEVVESIPRYSRLPVVTKKRKANAVSPIDPGQRDTKQNQSPTASPKRPKLLHGAETLSDSNGTALKRGKKESVVSAKSTTANTQSPRQVDITDFTASTALDVSRKVLYMLLSTPSLESENKVKQLEILGNTDVKAEKALKRFVKADGLLSLSELLKMWTKSESTESGVLLILKALVAMPGINRDTLKSSKIGARMQYLHRKSPFRNNQIRDLAGWIVGTWRTLLGIVDKSPEDSPHSASPRQDEAPKQQTGTSNQGHDVEPIPKLNTNGSSKDRNGHTKPSVSKETGGHKSPSSVSRNTESRQKSTAKGDDSKNEPKPAKPKESMNGRQSKSASHLKALMGGGKSALSNALGKKRLGTANNWKARRSTSVLDSVVKRVNEQATEREKLEQRRIEEMAEESRRRIRFNDDDGVLPFNMEVEVSKLFVWMPLGMRTQPNRPRPPEKSINIVPRSILKQRSAYPDVESVDSIANATPSFDASTTATMYQETEGPTRPNILSTSAPGGSADESLANHAAQLYIDANPHAHVRSIREATSPTDGRRNGTESRYNRSPPPPSHEYEASESGSAEDGEVRGGELDSLAAAIAAGAEHAQKLKPDNPTGMSSPLHALGEAVAAVMVGEHAREPPPVST